MYVTSYGGLWKIVELLTFVKKRSKMVDEMNPVNFKLDSFNFNVDHGYLEGIVKGFKSGILKQADYLNLTQCETLDGTYVGLRSENARIKILM